MKEVFLFLFHGFYFVAADLTDNKTIEKTCPKEWTYSASTGACYAVFGSKNWYDAQKHCRQFNGHLSTIRNKAEAAFLIKMGLNANPVTREIFIGTFTLTNDGKSKWINIDGTTFNYPYWGPMEPSNHSHEKCVEMHLAPNEYSARTGDLNNVGCYKIQNFVCKKKPHNNYLTEDYNPSDDYTTF